MISKTTIIDHQTRGIYTKVYLVCPNWSGWVNVGETKNGIKVVSFSPTDQAAVLQSGKQLRIVKITKVVHDNGISQRD